MDKNKSRTDMLAAGRKKLQQYRQKKDGKGSSSHAKSSKKFSKSEQLEPNADEVANIANSTETPQVLEAVSPKDSDMGVLDSSVSHSTESLATSHVDIVAVDSLSMSITPETALDDSSNMENQETAVYEDVMDSSNPNRRERIDVSVPPSRMETRDDSTPIDEPESRYREEDSSFVTQRDSLDIHAIGDQVTDEADCLGLKHSGAHRILELEEDGRSEHESNFGTPASERADLKDSASQLEQNDGADDKSASASAIGMSDGHLASTLSPSAAEGILGGVHEVENQSEEVGNIDPSSLENFKTLSETAHFGENKEGSQVGRNVEACKQQEMPEEPFVFVDKSHKDFLLTEIPSSNFESSAFPPGDVGAITFTQLIEVIKGLSEDEYNLLLLSRESTTSSISLQHNSAVLMERLREELFLTSCLKDILHLQLTEQSDLHTELDHDFQKLDSDFSVLQASLCESRDRYDCLAEELAACRSELKATVNGKEELQLQFHAAKTEVEEVAARENELQNCLERSQSDLLNLSQELANCKGLMGTLHAENENLHQTIALLTEEGKERVNEKNACLNEHEKLLKELSDCNILVAALQVESSEVSGTLASVTEECKKLEERKEYLATENEKLFKQLSNCKDLMEALQVENVNLRVELAVITEAGKESEEEKDYSVNEMERLSFENAVLNQKLSKDHREHMQLEADIEEVTMCLEQLTVENIFLKSSLEVLKTMMRESDDVQAKRLSINEVRPLDIHNRFYEIESVDELLHKRDGKQDAGIAASLPGKSLYNALSGGPPPESFQMEVLDESLGFVAFKGRLEEAEKILRKLEKAIEGANSHAGLLNRSGSKVAAPPVSKLIQAFESKSHSEEHEAESTAMAEDQSPAEDPFSSSKECAGDLKTILMQLTSDAANASLLFKAELESRSAASVTIKELKFQIEAMEEYTNNLEATNIEFVVLYEAVKQHFSDVKEKNYELECLYETMKQQNSNLKAENSVLSENLSVRELKIDEFQNQLLDLQLSSDELASALRGQLENFQKAVVDREGIAEQEWNFTIAQIIEALKLLDETTGPHTDNDGDGSMDIISHATFSVNLAVKTIGDLKEKLEVARSENEATFNLFNEVNEKCNLLLKKNDSSTVTLDRLYCELKKLVIDSCGSLGDTEIVIQDEKLPAPADYNLFKVLLVQLENVLAERLQLHSVNRKLNLDLVNIAKDVEEVNRKSAELSTIEDLIESLEGVVKLEDDKVDTDRLPVSRLEALISSLVRKCKEADEQVNSSRNLVGSDMEEFTEIREKISQLTALKLQYETEILLLKEHVSQVEDALSHVQTDLQEKVGELEQSEQKVSSLREKLSIAVAKGKGLVIQRDNLKKSLSETSSELERCSRELQLKDATLHEQESKLKVYSEAGERVEALESELSYIRNSATTLRESFLHKDSVLQRIEEIFEDLDLPENFHSRNIIEKVDWLARSATGNSLPPTEWEHKSSVGGSYSDAGIDVMDSWKEDVQPNSNSGEDLRRKYEDLQGKFYGLAEQNEMLEQSLMERNQLVQRWEELLNRIHMPAHLQTVEPEDRIEWLGNAFSEATNDRNSLLLNLDKFKNHCESLTADLDESTEKISCINSELEESQKRVSDLEMNIQAVINERENLSERLEILNGDHDKLSANLVQYASDNEKLQNEVTGLREKLVQELGNEKHIQRINGEIRRLQDLVCDALKDPAMGYLNSGEDGIGCLEELLKKLIEKYSTNFVAHQNAREAETNNSEERTKGILDVEYDVAVVGKDAVDSDELNMDVLKKKLDETMSELVYVREEKDRYLQKQQALVCEVEELERKKVELQGLLNQEEQKSASLREKLNVAVKKGKSLVQLRDSLKKTTEELSTELEYLRSEIKHRENALADYELKVRDLTSLSDRLESLESENLLLRNRLVENDNVLQGKEHILSMILNALEGIDLGSETYKGDPMKKLEHIAKLCRDMPAAVAFSEEESRKSRRAAELLLAELNEVQDRNDNLQEELSKVTAELVQFSEDKDLAEAAKSDALSRLEKSSLVHIEDKKKRDYELDLLYSAANDLRKSFSNIPDLVAGVSSKELEFMQNLKSGMKSCLQNVGTDIEVHVPLFGASDDNQENKMNFMSMGFSSKTNMPDRFDNDNFTEVCSSLQELVKEIGATKVMLHEHSETFHQQANYVSKLMGSIQIGITSQKESFETVQRDLKLKESVAMEKDMEIAALRRNGSLLYEACSSSLIEIENTGVEVANFVTVRDQGLKLKPARLGDGGYSYGGESSFSSEEHVRDMAEKLLLAVNTFASSKSETIEGHTKEMKDTISNLQKELQEKDIQRERICKDLVGQIKQAEATSTSYSLDLKSTKSRVNDLEKKLEMMTDEKKLLEYRVEELQDQQTILAELQEKVKLLTDTLSAKNLEIEALMQALDEEEVQMEDLTRRVEELEKIVQQKNLDIENLEASRGKAVKKLSITVSKFDELHHFSESLLVEVENLQAQLQDRDSEISFLRQEVTRCTSDALLASQTNIRRNSDEIYQLLTWLGTVVSLDVDLHDSSQVHECKEVIQKKITSILSELEDLRVSAQSSDGLLQMEMSKVEDLTRRERSLEKSLREKESQINMLAVTGELGQPTSSSSEIVEVEPVINKWAVPGLSTKSQVRSLRKPNNDQVAISIDMDSGGTSRLEDEDDDKVHGFKSLTSSRIVPKFTRPVTDMIDGLWVSCDRALMRQPALRLGIMIYWAILHVLLATFVV
ncbi:uncharacterized protein LOC126669146 isoform X2 [Mercurialis annua]|uniref:uncharacterized protein LOC126669146 isoform X2 n=1 Tax=Mercurialis annua TaxID=3986 RepID=UPI002160805F|nr:uncharacterized protein LOC126669146 isoform X2 [Mercurialis annua]